MRGLCLPAVLIVLGASPNLYISAGDRRDGPAGETRRVALNLTNTGTAPAREAQIDAITGIEVLTELPVSVTLVTSLPISLGQSIPERYRLHAAPVPLARRRVPHPHHGAMFLRTRSLPDFHHTYPLPLKLAYLVFEAFLWSLYRQFKYFFVPKLLFSLCIEIAKRLSALLRRPLVRRRRQTDM